MDTGITIEILPALPGHAHALDKDGRPTCGCIISADAAAKLRALAWPPVSYGWTMRPTLYSEKCQWQGAVEINGRRLTCAAFAVLTDGATLRCREHTPGGPDRVADDWVMLPEPYVPNAIGGMSFENYLGVMRGRMARASDGGELAEYDRLLDLLIATALDTKKKVEDEIAKRKEPM
jgi:hypothetical protein